MGRTTIQWCASPNSDGTVTPGFTVNPFRARLKGETATKGGYASGVGHYCEKISPGCRNCYSSDTQPRFGLPVFQEQRGGAVESFLDPTKLQEVLRRRVSTTWFWCDMTDMFGDWVPAEWIAACLGVMALTGHHTHQILTKRPERMRNVLTELTLDACFDALTKFAPEILGMTETFGRHVRAEMLRQGRDPGRDRFPFDHIWLGTSVEDRARLGRLDVLREIPSKVRFASFEPLLEDLGRVDLRGISWAIVGGESGDRARRFDVDWARSIRNQCDAVCAAFFMKQMGAHVVDRNDRFNTCDDTDPDLAEYWPAHLVAEDRIDELPHGGYQGAPVRLRLRDGHGGDPSEWPPALRVREWPTERLIRGETSGNG